jgi:uncharacterized membrane protein (DUF2068 family)
VPPSERRSGFDPLLGIALFKLVKASLLLFAGVSALSLLHDPDPPSTLRQVARELRFDPDNRLIHRAIASVSSLDARRLEELGIGTFVYAAVFATEGVGLLAKQRWAEYLTTGVTASLVPLELYELAKHPSPLKVAGIALNVLIVVLLVVRLRKRA